MQPEYDGVAEVWFESEEALIQGMSSPEGQKLGAALQDDEKFHRPVEIVSLHRPRVRTVNG